MKRKKRPDHVSHDRWLVSYADFITLLFAFFVVLYASAQVDKRKVGRLALAIQVGFKQMGVFDSSNTKPQVLGSETVPDDLENSQRDSQAASPDRPNMDEIEKQLAAPELIFERGEPPDATYIFKRGPARASDRLKAGQHAIEQSANAEAIGHLMRSLEECRQLLSGQLRWSKSGSVLQPRFRPGHAICSPA